MTLPRLVGEMEKGGDGFGVAAVLRWLIRRFVGSGVRLRDEAICGIIPAT